MGFASGSVTFRRLRVMVSAARREAFGPSEELLDALREHSLKEERIGLPNDVEYGWSGGRHIFDGAFSFEHNVYGDCVLFAMRVDSHKAPNELARAYQALEEEAAAAQNPSGFLSKTQKKEIKEQVRAKLEDELREGRHRRSKLVPVMWDTAKGIVYSPATGKSLEMLREIFERSFGADGSVTLEPMTAGSIALRHLEPNGKRRDYEDLRPTKFVAGPGGVEVEGESNDYGGGGPEYPWVAKGPEPKEFLGNEFLMWLWRSAEAKEGILELPDKRDVTVMIDRSLDLECAWGQTGRDGLRGDGPTRMPEARDALRSGKLPRKAGLILDSGSGGDEQYAFTFSAEGFAFGSAKLPEIQADTARQVVEERLEHIGSLCAAMDGLYQTFLKLRCSGNWAAWTADCRKWIGTLAAANRPRVQMEVRAVARRPEAERGMEAGEVGGRVTE